MQTDPPRSEQIGPKEPEELHAAYALQALSYQGQTGIRQIDARAAKRNAPYTTPVFMSPYGKVMFNQRRIHSQLEHLTEQYERMKDQQKESKTILKQIYEQFIKLQKEVDARNEARLSDAGIDLSRLKRRVDNHGSIVSQIQEKLDKSKKQNDNLLSPFERSDLQRALAPTAEHLASLELQIQTHINTPRNGILVWKIPEFSAKLANAQQDRNVVLTSIPFHTSPYGYRLSARLFPNGVADGKGTHLSVFITIMKGDYDDVLVWPFTRRIRVSLLTAQSRLAYQPESEGIIDPVELQSLCEPETFTKPKKREINPPAGITRLVPIPLLESRFLEEDCLYLKISVF